jgi:hypothetical protein
MAGTGHGGGAMTAKVDSVVTSQELTADEGRTFFDERCRELLGVSGAEFLEAYDSGRVWDWPRSEQVTELAMLLPFAR